MNKKLNTFLFIIGATVFNILVTIVVFILLFLPSYNFLLRRSYPPNLDPLSWMLPLFFILSIVASFVIYRFSLNFLVKKIDMEKYFDPIFINRRRRP